MNKLTLEIDALKVESFRTGAIRDVDGTVRGHAFEWEREDAVNRPKDTVGCSDGCTAYSCASGGDVCCA
jgi:hypothetical protein